MKIREFKPEDAMTLKDDLIEAAWNGELTLEHFTQIKEPAFTAVHCGQIIACVGVMVRGKEGIAWALFANSMSLTTALDGAIIVRDTLNQIIREHHLDRVYSTVREAFHKGRRYLHFLGFEEVGPMESNQRDGAETLMCVKEAA